MMDCSMFVCFVVAFGCASAYSAKDAGRYENTQHLGIALVQTQKMALETKEAPSADPPPATPAAGFDETLLDAIKQIEKKMSTYGKALDIPKSEIGFADFNSTINVRPAVNRRHKTGIYAAYLHKEAEGNDGNMILKAIMTPPEPRQSCRTEFKNVFPQEAFQLHETGGKVIIIINLPNFMNDQEKQDLKNLVAQIHFATYKGEIGATIRDLVEKKDTGIFKVINSYRQTVHIAVSPKLEEKLEQIRSFAAIPLFVALKGIMNVWYTDETLKNMGLDKITLEVIKSQMSPQVMAYLENQQPLLELLKKGPKCFGSLDSMTLKNIPGGVVIEEDYTNMFPFDFANYLVSRS